MSAVSPCPACGKPGRWGFDDDWCHETLDDALACDQEGTVPSELFTMAYCLAHHRSVYINIQDRAWVHADGWPCNALADAPISEGDLG